MVSAIVDTGSDVTIMRVSTANRLGIEIDKIRKTPQIISLTQNPVDILGMSKVEFHIGNKEVITKWIGVVPDSYINKDLLLGCDVLTAADFTWYSKDQLFKWGDVSYSVANCVLKDAGLCGVRMRPGVDSCRKPESDNPEPNGRVSVPDCSPDGRVRLLKRIVA